MILSITELNNRKNKNILVIVGRNFIMKLAFISDIHGSATALDAVLQDIKNSKKY